jgi:hypothetical protein
MDAATSEPSSREAAAPTGAPPGRSGAAGGIAARPLATVAGSTISPSSTSTAASAIAGVSSTVNIERGEPWMRSSMVLQESNEPIEQVGESGPVGERASSWTIHTFGFPDWIEAELE